MRFIGSKQNLIPFIDKVIQDTEVKGKVFFDIFSGTTIVAQYYKKKGYNIISNDNLYFSYVLQKTYIENNIIPAFPSLIKLLKQNEIYNEEQLPVENVFNLLNQTKGVKNYFCQNYAPFGTYKRMYITDENAKKIDGILQIISNWKKNNLITEIEEAILKTSLIESIPSISNISGTYGAFLKKWDKRALKLLKLEIPKFISSLNQHFCYQQDANHLIREVDADILYIDPPYNTRQYISNYHLLETVAKNDEIELKGKTGLRSDEILYKSKYCQKGYCAETLEDLIVNANTKYILLSYNSEGIIPGKAIEKIFKGKGKNFMRFEEVYRRFKSNSNKISEKAVVEYIYFIEVPKKNYYFIDFDKINKKSSLLLEQLLLFPMDEHTKKKTDQKIDFQNRGIYDKRNKLNNLTGKEWLYRTNSIELIESSQQEIELYKFIIDILETKYSTKGKENFSHNLRSIHPSPKPPQLMKKLIEFFTKENGWILDPFMGVGGTLLGASLINRNAVGIDLSSVYINVYKQVCKKENLKEQITKVGNSKYIDEFSEVNKHSFDLILTDPPYGNMMARNKTGEVLKRNKISTPTPFTEDKEDIGNEPLEIFLEDLKNIIEKSLKFLKLKGYLLIFTKDFQPTGNFIGMLHSEIVNKFLEIKDLSYKGYKIWYDKTINLYPYGYPFAYRSNQLHQFILIFRKEEGEYNAK